MQVLTLNYRNKKINIFGNYNYAYRENLNHLIINRNFYDNGVFQGSDDKDNYASMVLNHIQPLWHRLFSFKKNHHWFCCQCNFNGFTRDANINTIVNNEQYQPDFTFLSLSTNNDHFKNSVGNINFKHTFDSTGKS